MQFVKCLLHFLSSLSFSLQIFRCLTMLLPLFADAHVVLTYNLRIVVAPVQLPRIFVHINPDLAILMTHYDVVATNRDRGTLICLSLYCSWLRITTCMSWQHFVKPCRSNILHILEIKILAIAVTLYVGFITITLFCHTVKTKTSEIHFANSLLKNGARVGTQNKEQENPQGIPIDPFPRKCHNEAH